MIALTPIEAGVELAEHGVTVTAAIPAGHKIALRALATGDTVRRYGQIIGFAGQPIAAGDHIHTHNLAMGDFARDYAFGADLRPVVPVERTATFEAIVRPDGRVATRNYIGILTSVNCSATVARAVADYFRRDIRAESLADFPNVDGVVALTHGSGCAIDTSGEGLAILRRTLGGYATHPNFGAVVVIGLG